MCDKFIIKKDNNYKKKSRTVPQFSNISSAEELESIILPEKAGKVSKQIQT